MRQSYEIHCMWVNISRVMFEDLNDEILSAMNNRFSVVSLLQPENDRFKLANQLKSVSNVV
jgi:hypothetical protein